jgi:hypothetical protein
LQFDGLEISPLKRKDKKLSVYFKNKADDISRLKASGHTLVKCPSTKKYSKLHEIRNRSNAIRYSQTIHKRHETNKLNSSKLLIDQTEDTNRDNDTIV